MSEVQGFVGALGEFPDGMIEQPAANPAQPIIEQPVPETAVTPTEPPVAVPASGVIATPQPVEAITSPAVEPPAPATDWFDIQKVNERFGTSFQTEEEIKGAISSLTENQEYLKQKAYYTELETAFKDIIDKADPLKWFGSEAQYRKYMVAQQLLPGKDPGVIERLVNSDVDKLSDLDAMILQVQYGAPTLAGQTDVVTKGLLKDLGVDIDDPEFDPRKTVVTDPMQLVRMASKGAEARSFLKSITAGVQVPEIQNFDKILEQRVQEKAAAEQAAQQTLQKRTAEWTDRTKDIVGQFKQIDFIKKGADGKEVVDFTFAVPSEFAQKAQKYMVDWALTNGLDATPDAISKAKDELRDAFEDAYRNEIREAYGNDRESKAKAAMDTKVHNPQPINRQEAPESLSQNVIEQANKNMVAAYGLQT